MRLKTATAVSLEGGERRPLASFSGQSVHALAAIGNPQQFFATLTAAGLVVEGRGLPDHAHLTRADLDFGDDRPVFMTEKDAVKCAGLELPYHWYVEATAEFDADEAADIVDRVMRSLKG